MIKKRLFKTFCGVALGCIIGAFPLIADDSLANAQEIQQETTKASVEISQDDIVINSGTTKAEIEEMVENGSFDSSKLSREQIEHIYSLYDNDPETIKELQKQSDYNVGMPQLYSTNTYTHSPMFKGYDIIDGIDVSEWNGDINWKKVKASGIDFAIIRVGGRYYQGGGYFTDDKYKENIEGALDAGLDVGVYFFSAAVSTREAKEEAAYTMELIKGYSITLPIVMDYEYGPGPSGRLYDAHLSKSAATKVVTTFCNAVEAKGYVGMIYASKSVLADDMNAVSLAKKYPVWNAQYNSEDTLTSKHSYWQYSSTGEVLGIDHATDLNFRYIKKPATVTSLTYTATDSAVTLTWDKVPEVYGYQIARYDSTQDKYVVIGSVKGASTTKFKDSSLADGTTYQYKVRAYYKLKIGNKYGNYSSDFAATTISDQVKNVKLSNIKAASVQITWTEKGSVSGYRILRSKGTSTKYTVVKNITSAATNSYTDKGLLGGTKYNYKVQSYTINTDGTINYHDPSDVASGTTLPGKVTGLKMAATTSDSITITWNKQLNVAGYKVYKWNTSSENWQLIATLKGASKNRYTHKNLTSNKVYRYSVRAYYKSGNTTKTASRSDTVSSFTGVKAVTGLKASTRSTNSVTLSWNKNSKATGYEIYMYDPKTKKDVLVKRITSRDTCSYKITDLPAGKTRKFTIKPYRLIKNIYYYGSGTSLSTYTKPVATSKVLYRNFNSSTLLSWNKVTGGNGYMIYKYNKKCTKRTLVATIKGSGKLTYIAPKLSNGETYRVVTYKNVNGKKVLSNRSAAPVLMEGTLTGVITGDVVNVRKNAGTNYRIITEVTLNTSVTITGIKNVAGTTWYKVAYKKSGKKITGYVSGDYVKLKQNSK